MAKRKQLPGTIYVKHEDDGTGELFLVTDETTDSFEHGDRLGVYRLYDTKTVNINKTLK